MMKKHFENLWEDVEVHHVMANPAFDVSEKFTEIKEDISKLESDKVDNIAATKAFGRLLFNLCAVSQRLNVNTYTALVKEYQNQKTEILQ